MIPLSDLYADAVLLANKDVVTAAVRRDGFALEHAAAALQADKDVVMAAVETSGRALQYASSALQADKEVVLAAVKESGFALRYASVGLRQDKDVVMAAVERHCGALLLAHHELVADAKFLGGLLHDQPEGFFNDILFMNIHVSSGSSSCFLLDITQGEVLGEEGLQKLLSTCAARFGLDLESVLEHGELRDATTCAPVADSGLRQLPGGVMHDLQLVVQTAKRRRIEKA